MSRNLLKEILSADNKFIENSINGIKANSFREFCRDSIKHQDLDTKAALLNELKDFKLYAGDIGDEVVLYSDVVKIIQNNKDGVKL